MHGGEGAPLADLGQEREQRGLVLEPVDLVHHQHHRHAGVAEHAKRQRVFLVPAAGFDHQDRRVHPLERAARSAIHHPVHCALLLAVQSRSIDQHQLSFREGGDAQQPMARGLRPVGDDADLRADQGVGQGGLADVGPADHRNATAAVRGSDFAHVFESSCAMTRVAACCSARRREVPWPSARATGCSRMQATWNCLACSSPLSLISA